MTPPSPFQPRLLAAFLLAALALTACETPSPETLETVETAPADPPLIAPRASAVHMNRRTDHYDVRGTTAEEIHAEMRRRGPRGDDRVYFGRTAWDARWELTYAERSGSCRMRRADVWINVEQTLPRWQPEGRAKAALAQQWDAFLHALRRHEDGHEALAEQAGYEILRQINNLEAATCVVLKQKAHALARAALRRGLEANKRYDARTRHGRTEGVRWPPR